MINLLYLENLLKVTKLENYLRSKFMKYGMKYSMFKNGMKYSMETSVMNCFYSSIYARLRIVTVIYSTVTVSISSWSSFSCFVVLSILFKVIKNDWRVLDSLFGYSEAILTKFTWGGPFIVTVVTFAMHVNKNVGWWCFNQWDLGCRCLKSCTSSFPPVYLKRCRTVSVSHMLRQCNFKNVQNWTYFVDFLSKTQYLYIYELNFNVWQFYDTAFYDVTLLLPDRAKYLYK